MYKSGETFSNKGGVFAGQLINLYTKNLGDFSYFFIAIAAFTTPGALYGPVATGGLRFANSNKVFKPFTRSYYRHNLQVFTGVAGEGMHAHHILPQATRFQKYWKNVGININNPINMKWWEAGDHVSNSYDYNKAWDEFFELNSNPTKKQIINFGSNLMKDFGF
jgi:hypothetical protein